MVMAVKIKNEVLAFTKGLANIFLHYNLDVHLDVCLMFCLIHGDSTRNGQTVFKYRGAIKEGK